MLLQVGVDKCLSMRARRISGIVLVTRGLHGGVVVGVVRLGRVRSRRARRRRMMMRGRSGRVEVYMTGFRIEELRKCEKWVDDSMYILEYASQIWIGMY